MKHLNRPLNSKSGDLQNKMTVTLNMILLAFFIVLNSLAVPKSDRRKAALGSLIGSLGILPGGQSPMHSAKKDVSKTSAPLLTEKISAAKLIGEFEEYAIRKKIGRRVATIVTANGLELTLESSILFERNSAILKPSSYPIVSKIGRVFERIAGPFIIIGHSDNRQVKTVRYHDSLELTIGRAGAIARFFVNQTRVRRDNIAIAGYGPYRPLFPNDSPEHMKKNDRITIIYKRVT